MALILIFHNDSTGPDTAANYTVTVQVNSRVIAEGRVEGHDRSHSWPVLVQKFLDDAAWKDIFHPTFCPHCYYGHGEHSTECPQNTFFNPKEKS